MEPLAATACRDVLDRLRAQIHAHLPALVDSKGQRVSEQVVPLDRLPMVGALVQQYVEAEAVYAGANGPPPDDSQQQGGEGEGVESNR